MKKNMEERQEQILAEVADMLQGDAVTCMNALHGFIEALLIWHKKLVTAMPGKYRAELKQKLLNIIMVHVLSPCEYVHETLGLMQVFALYHKVPCSAEVRVSENCEERGES